MSRSRRRASGLDAAMMLKTGSESRVRSFWRLLAADGYVYICGSQPMRDAVCAAFVDVIAEHGSMPRERAEAYLRELEGPPHATALHLWG